MDYWEKCIRDALHDADINASEKQIQYVIEWVRDAPNNYVNGKRDKS